MGSSTLRDALKETKRTIPPPKRRREIDAKGAEAAGSGEEEEVGGDHGDARDPDSRAASCPACSVFDATDRAWTFKQTALSDSDAGRAVFALAAAGGEAAACKKGHREPAAEEFVIVVFDFIPTSGTTPPSPWKNE